MSFLNQTVNEDIQVRKLRKRIRRTLNMPKSKLNVMLKIREERTRASLETYVKSTWPVTRRQRRLRRLGVERRYRNML
jgi:hypothetical protein